MPEVSIVIPVYEVEAYLPVCLDSILAQTFSDWEAICVNDGSSDQCGDILKKYVQRDGRIKVITQKNQGVSISRNVALDKAKGKYICFLDSDDELAPTFLEEMLHLIVSTDADAVFCGIQKGEKVSKWIKEKPILQTYFDPFDSYIQKRIDTCAAVWGKIYKKEFLKGLHFQAEISQGGEDLLYLYQALYLAKKVVGTSQKLYFYRIRPNSVTSSQLSKNFVLRNIETAKLMDAYFKDKKLSVKTRKILNQKIAKRIFKFGVLEPKRKDKTHLNEWYALTRPLLRELKQKKIYRPKYLTLKNQLKSFCFLKKK